MWGTHSYEDVIVIEIWDKDDIDEDDFMGEASIARSLIVTGETSKHRVELVPNAAKSPHGRANASGWVEVIVTGLKNTLKCTNKTLQLH